MDLSIIIPCLNEEKTILAVINSINSVIQKTNIKYELLIINNNSTDNSKYLVSKTDAKCIDCFIKGYGAAIQAGIKNAKGKYCVMLDADLSYDCADIIKLYNVIKKEKADLIIGNRYGGHIEKNAMPITHKYIGTPILSWIGRSLWSNNIIDYNCGIRIFKTNVIRELNLTCIGMEFASEMIIKAAFHKLKIINYPVNYFRDKRGKKGNLHTIRDGLRHLKVLLGFFK